MLPRELKIIPISIKLQDIVVNIKDGFIKLMRLVSKKEATLVNTKLYK